MDFDTKVQTGDFKDVKVVTTSDKDFKKVADEKAKTGPKVVAASGKDIEILKKGEKVNVTSDEGFKKISQGDELNSTADLGQEVTER